MICILPRSPRLPLLFLVAVWALAAHSAPPNKPAPADAQLTGLARVVAIRHSTATDHVRVVIQFDRPVQYKVGTAVDPARIFFDLSSTAPAVSLAPESSVGDPVLQRIRVAQYQPGITRVVLDLTKAVTYTASFVADPPRLVIDLAHNASKAGAMQSNIAETPPLGTPPSQAKSRGSEMTPTKPPSTVLQPASDATVLAQAVAAAATGKSSVRPNTKSAQETLSPFKKGPGATPASALTSVAPTAVPIEDDTRLAARFSASARPIKDPAAVFRSYLEAAQRGVVESQFQLANLYMNGRGGPRDPVQAARWYTHAAQQGHALAASNLGVLFANGWGVGKNDVESVKWFRRAAEQGDGAGQANLGVMYLMGRGVSQSEVQGASWVRAAAEQGVTEAQHTLGTLYANGVGVPRDDAQAATWLQKAAASGYAPAQLNLGKLYLAGSGVPRDYHEAMNCFRRANTPEAWYEIGVLHQQGWGVSRSDAEAMVWYRKAAEQRLPEAQYAMGQLYRDRDPLAAYAWFALAAANGHKEGIGAMHALEARMTPAQLAQAQQRALSLAASHAR